MLTAWTLSLLLAAKPVKCVPLPPAGQWFHLSPKNAPRPSAREPDPVPIRVPLVMPVAGGLLVLTPYEGGRYDLCTDSWKPVGPVIERAAEYGLPSPMVSERELFFVGQSSSQDPFGFFARFDLLTNTWKALPREGAPTPRFGALQAWAGGRLVIMLGSEGVGASAKRLEDGALFDPGSNRWSALATPPHTVGFEAAVPLGARVFIWPHAFLYDVRANVWTQASRTGMGMPYQAALSSGQGELIAIGGNWLEGNVSRYSPATDTWRKAPTLKLDVPTTKSHHVVNGVPMVVGHPPSSEGTWAGPGAKLYGAHSCGPSAHRLYWLVDDAWRSTEPPAGTCWITLVTSDAVLLLRWPTPDAEGGLADGEARAFDPRSGTWRRAAIPAKNGPRSWGEVRWDGRALWQWSGVVTRAFAAEGQCQHTPANSGCDPVVTTTSQRVDEAWRLEPAWEPVEN